jgi:hypothetical protein
MSGDLPVLKKSHLFLYSLLLVSVLVFAGAATLPKASAVYLPQFVFKMNGQPISSLDVNVCSTFDLEVCINNLPLGYSLVGFYVTFGWVAIDQLEIVNMKSTVEGDTEEIIWSNDEGWATFAWGYPRGLQITSLFTVTFHCRASGTSTITFRAPLQATTGALSLPGSIDIQTGTEPPEYYAIGDTLLVCNQHAPAPTETPTNHVGGVLYSANKLSVLAPYLIGIFSIAAVAAVVVRKKLT